MTAVLTERDMGLLTIAEAARAVDRPPGTVRVWITRYQLATVRDAQGRTLVSERAVLECERDRRRAGGTRRTGRC